MIIECPNCESKVDGNVLAKHEWHEEDDVPFKVSFLKCPACNRALLAGQSFFQVGPDDWDWIDTIRLWPKPHEYLPGNLPESVRCSLEEAETCYRSKAFSACAVMCGRALEAICHEFKTKHKILGPGLKELLDRKIIDEKIYKWGEALREHRNIGAHASEVKVTVEDARDLLEFAKAICNYVFVVTEKFDDFIKRTKKTIKKKGAGGTPQRP